MPPPPPLPPAPPPPLPSFFGSGNREHQKPKHGEELDRNALLAQIRSGTHLKKAESNDRSAPLIDGTKASGGGGHGGSSKANGPTALIPPGGLFAQGIPKLRPTAYRTGDNNEKVSAYLNNRSSANFVSMESHSSILHANEVGGSRSHPPSPASKLRQSSVPPLTRTDSVGGGSRSYSGGSGYRHFPSDVNVSSKGPAPVPPPASHKPNYGLNSSSVSSQITNQNCVSSGIINKQPGVRRSVSQTNLGPRPRPSRPPPNVKPPPPPKSAMILQNGPPAPPSKPPNIMRRQSFGVGDTSNGSISSHLLSVASNDFSKPSAKLLGPPPPPRNNSAPNNLNQMHNSSPLGGHVNKMTSAPPPPPSRSGIAPTRPPNVRPPPPPMRAPAPPPPPPPPHRVGHPAPPSQLKATAIQNAPPPPPTRISSAKNIPFDCPISDFESRFFHKFHSIHDFPSPEPFSNSSKSYPSRAQLVRQSTRRQPPPPPPAIGNGTVNMSRGSTTHQPVLHIQLESRVFANNVAHC